MFGYQEEVAGQVKQIHVISTLGKSLPVQQNSDLQKLWNDILDSRCNELNTRFKPDTYSFMRDAAACLPRSDTFGDKALIPVGDTEHTVFVQQLKRKAKANETTNEKKETLVEVLDACPCDICLLQALLTLPMTTCTVERLFSAFSRIKTGTRVTTLTDR